MSSLRGATKLWTAATVNTADASAYATPGAAPYVAVFITSDKSITVKVQVSAGGVAVGAGLNELTTAADGGLTWFDYTDATAITVGAGGATCFDLSPFAPPYIRLVIVSATNALVTAQVASFGAN
jgi:hypothetical protein